MHRVFFLPGTDDVEVHFWRTILEDSSSVKYVLDTMEWYARTVEKNVEAGPRA